MNEVLTQLSASFGAPIWAVVLVLAIAAIWSLIWKGLALWKSARLNQPIWFVLLLAINSLGIFEILYIFLFSEIKLDKKQEKEPRRKARKKRR